MLVFVCKAALDEAEGIFVAGLQLGGDHILAERLLGTGDALREPEHKLPLLDVVGNLDEVFDECHSVHVPPRRVDFVFMNLRHSSAITVVPRSQGPHHISPGQRPGTIVMQFVNGARGDVSPVGNRDPVLLRVSRLLWRLASSFEFQEQQPYQAIGPLS